MNEEDKVDYLEAPQSPGQEGQTFSADAQRDKFLGGGSQTQEAQQHPEIPQIREGQSFIIIPELRDLNPRTREYTPASEEVTMARLNEWAEQLNRQGVEVVSTMGIPMETGKTRIGQGTIETRQVALVKKQPKSEQAQLQQTPPQQQ